MRDGAGAPRGPLHGVVAAALTPLRERGGSLDTGGVAPLVELYLDAGLVGVLVAAASGESLLLTIAERRRLLAEFVAAADGRFAVAAHAGAHSTADTVALAAHAAEAGASAVAVAPPPYLPLDESALLAHFRAAAAACAPCPFYLFEIRHGTGYPIPRTVVRSLLETAENLVGIQVSDPTIEEIEHYLVPGLDVLVGSEGLLEEAFGRGAVGTVSALAAALPRHVAAAVGEPPPAGAPPIRALRAGLERFPFHAAGKLAVIAQHVAIEPWVRPPLRPLTPAERTELEDWLASGILAGAVATTGGGAR